MRRTKGGRHIRRKGRIRRDMIFITRNCIMNTITLIPLDGKTGFPMMGKMKTEERRRVKRGFHSRWRALLLDENRIFHMGEIFYLREVYV